MDCLAVLRCAKGRPFRLVDTFPCLRHGGFTERRRLKNGAFGLVDAFPRCRDRRFAVLRCDKGSPFRLIHTFARFRDRGFAVLRVLRVSLHAQHQGYARSLINPQLAIIVVDLFRLGGGLGWKFLPSK